MFTLKQNTKKTGNTLILLIIAIGILLRFVYAWQVPYNVSSHDLGTLDAGDIGHLGYIQYLYQHRGLPDFSPIGHQQFYHPPFFHMIGAVVLALFYDGNNLVFCFELLQYLTTAFSCITVVYACRWVYLLIDKKAPRLFLVLFFSFCPTFSILGTMLNNDCLMAMLSTMALYYTAVWHRKPTLRTILKIAVCLGLAIFTKTNAILLSPAIGFVFASKLLQDRKNARNYVFPFAMFALICIPLGLFWVVRNYLLFDVPFNYVPKHPLDSPWCVASVSIGRRLGFPNLTQLTNVRLLEHDPLEHANIWGQTLSTMVFDEGILVIQRKEAQWLALLLLWGTGILSVGALASTALLGFEKKVSLQDRGLLVISFFTVLISYIVFCFQFPHVWTMNFRYAVPTLIVGALSMGLLVERLPKGFVWAARILTVVVSGISALLYLLCAV